MKIALPLLLIGAFALNACTTLANRRDLYSPEQPHGVYTNHLHNYEIQERSDPNKTPTSGYSIRNTKH